MSLEPLAAQAGSELEIRIIDGGQEEAAARGILRKLHLEATLVSEPDAGIYDAMNKGLSSARGAHVWFLNGGDLCEERNWGQLRELLRASQMSLVLNGYRLQLANRVIKRSPRQAEYIRHGLPTSHQAIFYPRDETQKIGYDASYRVAGDYHLTARLIDGGTPVVVTSRCVARFVSGGASSRLHKTLIREARHVQSTVLLLPWHAQLRSALRHWKSFQIRRALEAFWWIGRKRGQG